MEWVDFEVDSKSVADNVNSQQQNLLEFGEIIKECKRLLARYFMKSHVKFIGRQANEVAHALPRVAPSLASFHNFIDIPTCIQQVLINDMN